MTFCTLFNSVYADKGLALIHSFKENVSEYHLFVLAMDDLTYTIIKDLDDKNVTPIYLKDFENEELLSVKPERKLGEYYWTCSSWLISYVLDTYHVEYCTYVDADLYIYSDPHVIIEEMEQKSASVQIVSHHFKDLISDSASKPVGKYCVEFNTFKNDANGRMLLDIWKSQVLKCCKVDVENGYYGDQKYLDNWVKDYPFVIETENVGAGLGPWNLCTYTIKWKNDKDTPLVKRWGKEGKLLFYHFENILYLNNSEVDASLLFTWKASKEIIDHLYVPYLRHLRNNKQMLKTKYNVDVLIKKHPGFSPKIANKGVLERLYNIFINKRFLHSLRINIEINIPKRLFGKYAIINF